MRSCSAAGCHSGARPKENLSLEAGKAYDNLVDVPAQECSGRRRVVPGDPNASYLVQKLLGVDVCQGTQMPKAGQALPPAELDTINAWICSGATRN